MQFVNPFDRKNKKDEIPYSVFPASKITRTSMQIGRAVPVYTIEAIKNNTWKCSISQLTRFMTMEKPVMNDFQVNFGAFFVPYVALDDVTRHPSYAKLTQFTARYASIFGLNARSFFNPSVADSDRVLPIMRSVQFVGGIKLVGSLWDHLNYPVFDNYDVFGSVGLNVALYDDANSVWSILSWNFTQVSQLFDQTNASVSPTMTFKYEAIGDASTDVVDTVKYMPFDLWCLTNPSFNFYNWNENLVPDWNTLTTPGNYGPQLVSAGSALNLFHIADTSLAGAEVTAFWNAINSGTQWEYYFGKYTREQVFDMYWNYLHNSLIIGNNVGNAFTANLLPWLAYLRIYGDYFLNELVTDKEMFFGAISAIYCTSANSPSNTLIQSYTSVSAFTSLFNNNTNFFFDYLIKGECLPVLWEKDFFTSAQIKETSGSDVTIASGDTIPTLFYKRMYQRFKDLIARMGSDYKTNVDALYGGKIPDSTLQRSQVIGFKKFNVSVGAIAQTSESSAAGTLADFGGYAYSNDKTDSFEWTAEENGIIMILCWVRPLFTAISSATPRFLIKQNYLDFLLPQFGGVGYQDIPNKLLNASLSSAYQNIKYGIQERYFEYMTLLNESTGNFRDIARQYAVDRVVDSTTQLSETGSPAFLYITEDDDINRIFMDSTNDPILCSIYFDGTITRQLPATIRTDF